MALEQKNREEGGAGGGGRWLCSAQGMYSKGSKECTVKDCSGTSIYHPKIPDPSNPAVQITPNPPGFWYYVDPHAMKRYSTMLLNTLKVHHITDIVMGDRLVMEQVINWVGEGYSLSTAIVDTLDSTTITQLLSATGLGRFPIR